jgi:hypothetical protein
MRSFHDGRAPQRTHAAAAAPPMTMMAYRGGGGGGREEAEAEAQEEEEAMAAAMAMRCALGGERCVDAERRHHSCWWLQADD